MTTPERSVEEIVEEWGVFFKQADEYQKSKGYPVDIPSIELFRAFVTQERQKREEVVQRINLVAQSNYDPTRGWILCTPEDLFITQLNNHK